MKEKICPICGNTFLSENANSLYCTKKCKYRASYERRRKNRIFHDDAKEMAEATIAEKLILLEAKKYREREDERKQNRKKKEIRFNQKILEANKLGISYGMYVAMYK